MPLRFLLIRPPQRNRLRRRNHPRFAPTQPLLRAYAFFFLGGSAAVVPRSVSCPLRCVLHFPAVASAEEQDEPPFLAVAVAAVTCGLPPGRCLQANVSLVVAAGLLFHAPSSFLPQTTSLVVAKLGRPLPWVSYRQCRLRRRPWRHCRTGLYRVRHVGGRECTLHRLRRRADRASVLLGRLGPLLVRLCASAV